MTLSEALALLSVLALWSACGLLPWCVALIAGRGRGALIALVMVPLAGMAGGLLVAALAKDGAGFAVSVLAAVAAGAIVATMIVRRARDTSRTPALPRR